MENKNGQGIFYGVIGVATLVVAIIGATFAYFSATVSDSNANVTGGTYNNVASNLSLDVNRVDLQPSPAPVNDLLVPADFGTGAMTTDKITAALTKDCVDDGYTGCHVYSLQANSSSAVSTANFTVLLTTDASDVSNWKWVVYDGTTSAASAIKGTGTALSDSASNPTATSVAITGGLNGTDAKTYYLMVYLENVESSQNGVGTGATDARGTYTGTVQFEAAGGHVKATFTAQAAPDPEP